MARQSRPIFIIALRPASGVNGIRALRAGLKLLLRRFGLRCVTIREARKLST